MNEIVAKQNDAVIIDEKTGEIKQNFNRNLGEKPIRISIKVVKKVNSVTKKPFNDVSGLKHLDVLANEDLENAGALGAVIEVVVDSNLITSRIPDDLPAFNKAIINALT